MCTKLCNAQYCDFIVHKEGELVIHTVWVTKKYPFFVKQRPCNENFAFRFRARSVLHITVFIFAVWAKLF